MTFPDVEDLTLVTDESYRRTMEKNHEESGACQLNFKKVKETDVEEVIGAVLKMAPYRLGGKKQVVGVVAEEDVEAIREE
ncbi:hypothetical protein UPYG_G00246870 [Umbra pygmaea]|uniref:Uncharacterized protein n=1 Tax=Umbra pygmaea TaxID=75934 RepID=A0ABD0WGE3_UMBPY